MSWTRSAVAALVVVVSVTTWSSGAAAEVGGCAVWDSQGYCVEWDVSTPGGPSAPGGSTGGGGPPPECYWVNMTEGLTWDPTIGVDFGVDQPPEGVEVVWQEWVCSDGQPAFDFRWVVAATPLSLASTAQGRLVGTLPQPVVESSPPVGTPSIVRIPVFVAVSNWTGVVAESECAGGLCVTVTATPSLVFRPGEPGAGSVTCAGSGSRYSPEAGSVEAQASEPGACTYTYGLRTGIEARPGAWPGEVSVTWSIRWSATTGASGSLPSVTRSSALPRAVSEVQAVVSGGATP